MRGVLLSFSTTRLRNAFYTLVKPHTLLRLESWSIFVSHLMVYTTYNPNPKYLFPYKIQVVEHFAFCYKNLSTTQMFLLNDSNK